MYWIHQTLLRERKKRSGHHVWNSGSSLVVERTDVFGHMINRSDFLFSSLQSHRFDVFVCHVFFHLSSGCLSRMLHIRYDLFSMLISTALCPILLTTSAKYSIWLFSGFFFVCLFFFCHFYSVFLFAQIKNAYKNRWMEMHLLSIKSNHKNTDAD